MRGLEQSSVTVECRRMPRQNGTSRQGCRCGRNYVGWLELRYRRLLSRFNNLQNYPTLRGCGEHHFFEANPLPHMQSVEGPIPQRCHRHTQLTPYLTCAQGGHSALQFRLHRNFIPAVSVDTRECCCKSGSRSCDP